MVLGCCFSRRQGLQLAFYPKCSPHVPREMPHAQAIALFRCALRLWWLWLRLRSQKQAKQVFLSTRCDFERSTGAALLKS